MQQTSIKTACFPGSRAFEGIQGSGFGTRESRGHRDCCTDRMSNISGEETGCWSSHVEIIYCIGLLSICTIDNDTLEQYLTLQKSYRWYTGVIVSGIHHIDNLCRVISISMRITILLGAGWSWLADWDLQVKGYDCIDLRKRLES